MFLLSPGPLPTSTLALLQSLHTGLEQLQLSPSAASAEGDFPRLSRLSVDLTGANIPPTMRPAVGSTEPAPVISVGQVQIGGQDLRMGQARLNVHLEAQEAALVFGATSRGESFITLQRAQSGSVSADITSAHLEKLVMQLASEAARPQGIEVESVKLKLVQKTERRVAFEALVIAGKMFLKAVVRLSGEAELDSELNATVENLACKGDGFAGTMACGVIEPYLEQYTGRKISLLAFSLGEVKLRDAHFTVGDVIKAEATFGS